jgi:probable phosphoglycerate mutase
VLIVRHGQSEWNALGRWQGQADPPLTELGLHQAAHAAQHVGAVDAVVASDLERSRLTAENIAELVGNGPVLVDAGFRERDAGEGQGLTKAEIGEQWPGYL